jgi:hypothetical protein
MAEIREFSNVEELVGYPGNGLFNTGIYVGWNSDDDPFVPLTTKEILHYRNIGKIKDE